MANTIATSRGYFGGVIREIGDSFVVPDEVWNDKKRRPSWAKLAKGGGKADDVAKAEPPADAPAGPLTIPPDWQSQSAAERRALAEAISGEKPPNAKEADVVISAYIEGNSPAPFADAPEPEMAGNGIQKALGGTHPDWVEPGTGGSGQSDI